MSQVKETVRKLNKCYYETRANIIELSRNELSPAKQRKMAEHISHLDQLINAFKTQVQELEDTINPPLPEVSSPSNDWKN